MGRVFVSIAVPDRQLPVLVDNELSVSQVGLLAFSVGIREPSLLSRLPGLKHAVTFSWTRCKPPLHEHGSPTGHDPRGENFDIGMDGDSLITDAIGDVTSADSF